MTTPCTRCGKQNPADIHTCTPLALRLADALLEPVVLDKHAMQAAAELRRLHSENVQSAVVFVEHQRELSKALDQRDELLEALKLADLLLSGANMNRAVVESKVRAAIAKVEGGAA